MLPLFLLAVFIGRPQAAADGVSLPLSFTFEKLYSITISVCLSFLNFFPRACRCVMVIGIDGMDK